MQLALGQLPEHQFLDLLHPLFLLVLPRGEHLLDQLRILLLLSHHRVVEQLLLLSQFLFQNLGACRSLLIFTALSPLSLIIVLLTFVFFIVPLLGPCRGSEGVALVDLSIVVENLLLLCL